MKQNKLSVVLATYNEESNIADCLKAVQSLADEIIIVDGGSTDQTVEIAESFKAQVIQTDNPPIFHINKQKAIDAASRKWVLQLDADERVTPELAKEIEALVNMSEKEIEEQQKKLQKTKLFINHLEVLERRDGKIGNDQGSYAAFFVPRLNYFLGKYLRHGGVYPDGVIRLIKKGQAYLPCKDVHEQMVVLGRVGWLEHDLIHLADPTFHRYLERNSRYINLLKDELVKDKVGKDLGQIVIYILFKPLYWFLLTYIRHRGFMDGWPGFVFSFFSALKFPRAYFRYFRSQIND